MPDFGPYLVFRLYLYRMQKYAFFSVCANIPGENPSSARFFNFSARGGAAFLLTKRGRKGKTAPSGCAIYQKKRS